MPSFCGFCGAKASDNEHFCADCGGKLEPSIDSGPSVHSTMPLPPMRPAALDEAPGIILSKSFVDLIKQEASIGKEISPIASIELSRSFLDLISDPKPSDPVGGDTLREVPKIKPPEHSPTLPDFVPAAKGLSELPALRMAPVIAPTVPNPKAAASPALPKSAETIPIEQPPDTLRVPQAPLDTLRTPQLPASSPPGPDVTHPDLIARPHEPTPEESSVVLSKSLEEIARIEAPAPAEPPKPPAESTKKSSPLLAALPPMPATAPRSTMPKLELSPRSALLSEPASVRTEGFLERLGGLSLKELFSLKELDRTLQSGYVWSIAFLAAGAALAPATGGLALSLLAALFFFRVIAEERQSLKLCIAVSLASFGVGFGVLTTFFEALRSTPTITSVTILAIVSELLKAVPLVALWVLKAPGAKKDFFAQPMDGVLYSLMSGVGFSAVFLSRTNVFSLSLALEHLLSEALFAGFFGYFVGLARFRANERSLLLVCGLSFAVGAHIAFNLIQHLLRPFGALLLFGGYFVLFSYIIKQKQLERG